MFAVYRFVKDLKDVPADLLLTIGDREYFTEFADELHERLERLEHDLSRELQNVELLTLSTMSAQICAVNSSLQDIRLDLNKRNNMNTASPVEVIAESSSSAELPPDQGQAQTPSDSQMLAEIYKYVVLGQSRQAAELC